VTVARGQVAGTEDLRAGLGELLAAPPPLLVVSDFDGTLSPIQMEPMGAWIEPLGRRALRRLARLAARRPERLVLVVLSGRLASDVASRVRVGGLRYLGNHGIEGGALARGRRAERLSVAVDEALQRWVTPAETIAARVADRLGRPAWLFVEPKGPTVAFHFRQAPDPATAKVAVIEAIEAAEAELGGTGLVQVDGRRIVELRPEVAGGKGAAVARLIERERPGAVLVLGDDVSDAEAFEAMRAARGRGEIRGLAAAVHGAAETPEAVRASADAFLPSTRDAARLLATLATALERETARPEPARPEPADRDSADASRGA
jgi:trehalose-phosphatase